MLAQYRHVACDLLEILAAPDLFLLAEIRMPGHAEDSTIFALCSPSGSVICVECDQHATADVSIAMIVESDVQFSAS
jgi:hypothetical protein